MQKDFVVADPTGMVEDVFAVPISIGIQNQNGVYPNESDPHVHEVQFGMGIIAVAPKVNSGMLKKDDVQERNILFVNGVL